MSSDNLLAALVGVLEGSQRSVDMFLQDSLVRRRQREQGQIQMDIYRQKVPMERDQATFESDLQLEREREMAGYKSSLSVDESSKDLQTKTNPDDYIQGSDIMQFAPTLKLDANKKYSKSLLPVIENRNKREENLDKLAVPGFDLTGEVRPDETEAKKLRDGLAEYETFKQGLQEYRSLIDTYGTTEVLDREGAASLNAASKNLQLKVKNLAQLGVLSWSDIPFIERQIPKPGVFTTKSGTLGALKTTEKLMESSIMNRMKSSGYKQRNPMGGNISSQIQSQLPGGAKIKKIIRIQ